MKTFKNYLTESTCCYEFKIKIAGIELDSDAQDRIEHALKAFDLDRISKPKHLPIKDQHIDFPSMGNVDVYLITVSLKYPCTDAQLRQTISVQGRIPLASIVVIPKNQPEELRREAEEAAGEQKDKKALLDTPDLGGECAQDKAGQKYTDSMLKDLQTRKYDIAGEATPKAKTTNDLPQNNTSPVRKGTK
jgi:hypothetical protein